MTDTDTDTPIFPTPATETLTPRTPIVEPKVFPPGQYRVVAGTEILPHHRVVAILERSVKIQLDEKKIRESNDPNYRHGYDGRGLDDTYNPNVYVGARREVLGHEPVFLVCEEEHAVVARLRQELKEARQTASGLEAECERLRAAEDTAKRRAEDDKRTIETLRAERQNAVSAVDDLRSRFQKGELALADARRDLRVLREAIGSLRADELLEAAKK